MSRWPGNSMYDDAARRRPDALFMSRALVQSERLRTFGLAGHPLRKGTDGDTTAVPALIPIPEGFGQVSMIP